MELIVGIFVVLQIVAILAVVVLLRRVMAMEVRINGQIDAASDNLFRQAEALHGLYVDLDPSCSLPETRDWSASPDLLRSLVRYIQGQRPQSIIECGSGVSTVVMARALQRLGKGHLWSLEHDANHREATQANLRRHGLQEWATVVAAPLSILELSEWKGQWYSLAELPPDLRFDLAVVDGPPFFVGALPRYPALPMLFPRLIKRASVFLDDANRPAERECVVRWMEKYPQFEIRKAGEHEKGLAVLTRN